MISVKPGIYAKVITITKFHGSNVVSHQLEFVLSTNYQLVISLMEVIVVMKFDNGLSSSTISLHIRLILILD